LQTTGHCDDRNHDDCDGQAWADGPVMVASLQEGELPRQPDHASVYTRCTCPCHIYRAELAALEPVLREAATFLLREGYDQDKYPVLDIRQAFDHVRELRRKRGRTLEGNRR
jgi:hypothetical protein